MTLESLMLLNINIYIIRIRAYYSVYILFNNFNRFPFAKLAAILQ